jgi:hypothetical protein
MEFMVAAERREWRVRGWLESASELREKPMRVGTPVVTESMRNRLRPEGIEAPRGAYDGGSKGVARMYTHRVVP